MKKKLFVLSDIHGHYAYKMSKISFVRYYRDEDHITIFEDNDKIMRFDYETPEQAAIEYENMLRQLKGMI